MSRPDSLGDRMKGNYEDRCRPYLLRRTPVIIRIDGRAFHTVLKKAEKPFDPRIVSGMLDAALSVAKEMQGFKAGFVQSDEASFLLMDNDTNTTEAWFDYNQQKLVSISAALMTGYFGATVGWWDYSKGGKWHDGLRVDARTPVFDARAFNVPDENEVANYFLWRAKDWERNSVSMFARAFYSHKQLHGKGRAATLEMLEADGHRWNELPAQLRNGSWLSGGTWTGDVKPTYADVSEWLTNILYPTSEDDI